MKLTKKKAIELSIKKWEWIVKEYDKNYSFIENENMMVNDVPELLILSKNNRRCGICDYIKNCNNCPLAQIDFDCGNSESKYDIWCNNETKANAQAVLDLIKSL